MSKSLAGNYQQEFGEQQTALTNLNAEIGQIGQATPGFSGAENASNISQIENTGAATAKNSDQATMDAMAGQGGGGASGIRNGVQAEIRGQTNTSAANQESNALLQNTSNNYAVGRQNTAQRIGGFSTLAGEYNPAGYASGSLNATNQDFNESNTIQQQQAAKAGAIASMIEKGASMAATAGMAGIGNLDTAGTSTGGEQVGNFLSGALGSFGG